MANFGSAKAGSWFCLGPSESPVVQRVASAAGKPRIRRAVVVLYYNQR